MVKSIVNWKIENEVATQCKVPTDKASKVIKLINDGSTIPFIARYRKECTGNMAPATLNKIKDKMEEYQNVIQNVEKSLKSFEKNGMLNETIMGALQNCKSMDDIEFVTEPYKPKTAKSMISRARQVGLDVLAFKILNSPTFFDVNEFVPPEAIAEFGDIMSVEEPLKKLISDIFSKDLQLLDQIEKLNCSTTSLIKSTLKKKYTTSNPKEKISDSTKKMIDKLKPYHNFSKSLDRIFPHQIMAINRGEKAKVLKVTVEITQNLKRDFIDLCNKRYLSKISPGFIDLVSHCVIDSYDRLVLPHIIRKVRSQMTKQGQNESLLVFESNLRQLVMSSPLRGVPIAGLDPGYYNGCKFAIINESLLDTGVLFLTRSPEAYQEAEIKFVRFILKHSVQHIAIGDGKGRNEAIEFICNLKKKNAFNGLDVKYAIIRECGASVYSVSEQCADEFPDLDPNIRSAISIARRLQDPLAEYVKLDPKNLGVGMYQHDLSSKSLVDKINMVLDECISFVGVDINHAPAHILQHVSGLGPTKANSIIQHRIKHGPFKNRRQLLTVRGIKSITYTQCAGFVRIKHSNKSIQSDSNQFQYEPDGDAMMVDLSQPPNSQNLRNNLCRIRDDDNFNPLDQTSIHPESYEIAERLVSKLQLVLSDVGTDLMQEYTKAFMNSPNYLTELKSFETEYCGLETLKDIVMSLSLPLEFDERFNFNSSMLWQTYIKSDNLSTGDKVIGCIYNVTTFGLFLDIGVERTAFCPRSNSNVWVLGDMVECRVELISHDKLTVEILRKIMPSSI